MTASKAVALIIARSLLASWGIGRQSS